MDFSNSDGCIERSKQSYYQPIHPGTHQFSIFTGEKTNCQGSLIVTSPSVQVAAGDVWELYAMGDATNGYAIKPVKLERN